jgi:hypothetical protein
MTYGKKDELVPIEFIEELNKRLSAQKGIKVEFQSVPDANHFFSKSEKNLISTLEKYIKKETTVF